jgi:hypothetical protein
MLRTAMMALAIAGGLASALTSVHAQDVTAAGKCMSGVRWFLTRLARRAVSRVPPGTSRVGNGNPARSLPSVTLERRSG